MSKPEKALENGHTLRADFDRNREGLYGGLAQARGSKSPAPVEKPADKDAR